MNMMDGKKKNFKMLILYLLYFIVTVTIGDLKKCVADTNTSMAPVVADLLESSINKLEPYVVLYSVIPANDSDKYLVLLGRSGKIGFYEAIKGRGYNEKSYIHSIRIYTGSSIKDIHANSNTGIFTPTTNYTLFGEFDLSSLCKYSTNMSIVELLRNSYSVFKIVNESGDLNSNIEFNIKSEINHLETTINFDLSVSTFPECIKEIYQTDNGKIKFSRMLCVKDWINLGNNLNYPKILELKKGKSDDKTGEFGWMEEYEISVEKVKLNIDVSEVVNNVNFPVGCRVRDRGTNSVFMIDGDNVEMKNSEQSMGTSMNLFEKTFSLDYKSVMDEFIEKTDK